MSWEQVVTIRQLLLNLLPCEKQECQITHCNPKIKNISLYLHATRPKQSLSAMTTVNVQTLSNQNSLDFSKTFSKN